MTWQECQQLSIPCEKQLPLISVLGRHAPGTHRTPSFSGACLPGSQLLGGSPAVPDSPWVAAGLAGLSQVAKWGQRVCSSGNAPRPGSMETHLEVIHREVRNPKEVVPFWGENCRGETREVPSWRVEKAAPVWHDLWLGTGLPSAGAMPEWSFDAYGSPAPAFFSGCSAVP